MFFFLLAVYKIWFTRFFHSHILLLFFFCSFKITVPEAPGGRPGLPVHLCMTPASQGAIGPAQAHSIALATEST